MTNVLSPATLPVNDNINRYSFCVDVVDQIFIQKGKMIAYYGNLRFEALGSSVLDILVKEAFNAPMFVNHFICVVGRGKLILGDQGHNIASYDLDNANLTVKASHLLGFQSTLHCQESTLPGYLTLLGTGKMLASSNGPVHFMEPPCRADADAVLGWADCPSPSFRYDYEHIRGVVSAIGAVTGFTMSGEEKQVDFTGKGTILVQSSEERAEGHSPQMAHLMSQLHGLQKDELTAIASMANGMARVRE